MKSVKIICAALFGCAISVLSGCASIDTKITTYYVGSSTLDEKSFVIIPDGKDQEKSLEFVAQKQKLEARFVAKGMRLSEISHADYIVLFHYGIDEGKMSIASTPVYGMTEGGTTNYSGSVAGTGGSATYAGSETKTSQFGVVGSQVVSGRDYNRFITIEIFENQSGTAGKKLYETKAISVGPCDLIAPLISPMLDAIFQEYPGPNGIMRKVTINMDDFSC